MMCFVSNRKREVWAESEGNAARGGQSTNGGKVQTFLFLRQSKQMRIKFGQSINQLIKSEVRGVKGADIFLLLGRPRVVMVKMFFPFPSLPARIFLLATCCINSNALLISAGANLVYGTSFDVNLPVCFLAEWW